MNKNWQMHTDDKNIIWLGMDRAHVAVNAINDAVLDELNSILHEISQTTDAKGLIIYSAKSKGFIAGADINAIANLSDASQAVNFLKKGQDIFLALERLHIPTVAAIDGFCMGGGLELALACDYRIATDDIDTKIGLPEVLLGIHPGWGGSVRLPRLIGGFDALSKLILSGAPLAASKAKALGVVDDVVAHRQLFRAAITYINTTPPKHKPSFIQSVSNYSWARKAIAKMLRKALAKKVRVAHYPAPNSIIDLWLADGGGNAYAKEIDSVEQLIMKNDTAFNLIRIFLLRERMKNFAKSSNFKAVHVHVIGAGVMGGDIAAWCALRGLRVTLQDKSYAQIAPAIGRAYQLYNKKLRKPRLVQAAMDNLSADPDGYGIAHADVIIEAVFENLEVKQDIMRKIEAYAKPSAIIASNTSSILLEDIAQTMLSPQRLVGIHFFNPVARMELIEIVSSTLTTKEVAESACAFVAQIGRLPLPVSSSPGFLVNRVLTPYLMECVLLLAEGYSAELIDEAALNFGMMMGPVELADTVGIDICLAVAVNLSAHFGGSVPDTLSTMVASGKLGRKSGAGFYRYKQGKAIKNKITKTDGQQEITDRLIFSMLNAAAACLREKVVADSDLLDAGMIFGAGFAPFRGGPMHYIEQFGSDKILEIFARLEAKYGERFKADQALLK